MTVERLLRDLVALGISLAVDEGQLRVRAPKGALTQELKDALAGHKAALMQLLSAPSEGTQAATPIARVERSARLPLSLAQQRLWVLDQLEGGRAIYHVPACAWLDGPLDLAALQHALRQTVERHEALRTTFVTVDGEPVQRLGAVQVTLAVDDVSSSPDADSAALTRATELARIPFALSTGPLFRTRLFRVRDDRHLLSLTLHHTIADAWSMGVLVNELGRLYEAAVSGTPAALPVLEVQYADFAAWQREHLRGASLDSLLGYWRENLAGATPLIDLPHDRPRPAMQSFTGAIERFAIDADRVARIRAVGDRRGATLFQTLLAAFQLLLHRYSGQDSVVVGSPVANRLRFEVEPLIGFFVNTLALRADFTPELTFLDLLDQVQATTVAAYAHQELPFELLVSDLSPARSLSYNPIFQVMFALQNTRATQTHMGNIAVTPGTVALGISKFDLYLSLEEQPDGSLGGEWEYASDLFEATTVTRMIGHFVSLIDAIALAPNDAITQLPMMAADEVATLARLWQGDELAWPSDQTITDLVSEQSARTPTAVAIVDGRTQLTYSELERRANQVAHHLRAAGVLPETRVGLCVERTCDAIVGLIGILKAGGAYVPLDPAYPRERVAFMASDAALRFFVAHLSTSRDLPADARVVLLDADRDQLDAQPTDRLPSVASDSLAYVIYTSGSTGTPKGIQIEHRNAVSMLAWAQSAFSADDLGGMLASTSFCFDLSVFEIFLPLISGGTVVLAANALALADHPERNRVTLVNTVPSAMAELVRSGSLPSSVRIVNLAGEPLKAALVDKLYAQSTVRDVFDLYGPGETTTYSTWGRRQPGGRESIGRPIANTRLYILDHERRPVPLGVAGEIYLAGPGVTRGYLNRDRLTGDRYVTDPFAGGRMYRTGDVGRFWPDGDVQYLGRIDHQVKIRGFRIELGEIEHAMAACDGVRDTIVHVADAGLASPRLVACFTGDATVAAVREHLRGRLPSYMVPAAVIRLDALPLTPNGKVDRSKLPVADTDQDDRPMVAPSSASEVDLSRVWSDVLQLDRLSTTDNFFEIGGDSILAIQIASKARQAGWAFAPAALFQHQTIAELAAVATPVETALAVAADEELAEVALTPVQQWGLAGHPPAPHHFNQWLLLELPSQVTSGVVRDAVHAVAAHHSAFRLRFQQREGVWRQWFGRSDTGLTFAEMTLASEAEVAAATATIHGTLDLEHGPVGRAVLVRVSGQSPRLLLTIHHLVIDGVSWRIFGDDLVSACRSLARGEQPLLPAPTASYRQWAAASDPADESALSLTAHGVYGDVRVVAGTIDAATTSALLTGVPAAYNARLDEALVAALAITLAEFTGETSHTIDLEGHGRDRFDHLDVARTIGWFTHIAPVTLAAASRGWGSLIARAKSACRTARAGRFATQGAVSLNYLGQLDQALAVESGWRLAGAGLSCDPARPRRHDLDVVMSVREGRLAWTIEFTEPGHRAADITRLSQIFQRHLEQLAAHCADPASGGYAPGDFPDLDLSTADLDVIRAMGPRFHRNIESILPVSPAQEGILFHSLLAGKSDVYVTQLRCELTGALDPIRFREAWEAVVARHGALRTALVRDSRQNVLQITLKQAPLPFVELDWRNAGPSVADTFCDRDRQQPFDLATAPLMRVTLARTGDATWQFIWTSHHAVLDGWSLGLVLRDLASHYGALRLGQRVALPALLPYRHYARVALRPVAGADEAFWQREVTGWCEPLDPGFIRPATVAGARVTARLTLSEDDTRQLQQFARTHRLTLHSILQGAWAVVLARYTDRDDVLFGGVVSGRSGSSIAGTDSAAGLFIQTVPVRTAIRDDQPVTAWLEAIQQRQVARESHAHVPLVRIRELTPLPRGIDLFETLLVLENYPIDQALHQRLGDLAVHDLQVAERPHYPLTIVGSGERRLDLAAVFDNSRVDATAVPPLLERFAHVLSQIARGDGALVGTLSVMTPAEHQRVVVDWNATERPYETGVTLTDLFERQVHLTPNATAVVFGSHSLTYAELDRRANQVGHALQADGVGPDTLVGVCLDRSLEMVIALYGILKAGGAYVPIDPSYPRDRRELMVRDSAVSIVLDQARVAGIAGPTTAPPRTTGSDHLAYMIYTSGSTGTPKGALNTHAAIVNRLQWMQEAFGLRDDDRVLQKTPFSFDVSVWEFFWPLITGAQLVVAEPGGHLDPAYLADTIARHGITTLHFVPSMLQVFLEAKGLGRAGAVRRVITSGEALTPEHVRGFHAAFAGELHNLYGPTEAAVDVTWWPCPRDPQISVVPIGRPIANTRMYVLDRRLRPVPAGVAGELYIGGVQVGRGYWRRPDLTAERFLTDPFSATPGARMYRTGDRARFQDDGAIEYLGRLDHQVKIRGVRIELGEVEAVLRSHESVREAVAIVRTHRGDTQLIAYVVPREGTAHASSTQLRAHLRSRLPEVMVPSFIVGIAAIPLSPNGKLDRRALPDPTDAPAAPAPAAAESLTTIERTIAEAWRTVLGGEHFGPGDNFFDVGGHSLSAMRVHALLQPAFGPALSLLTLFEHPTVGSLARHLAGTAAPVPLARSKRRRQHDGPYDIAVVAMACRVPGASSTEALWDNLISGREQIVRFSHDDLLGAGEDPDRLRDPHYVNAYGALADADHFDAGFFDIPAAEAEILDPQQRVFLECAWELFERAGYDPRRLKVPVGVYAGAGMNSYALHHLYSRPDVIADRGGFPLLIASDKDFLPTRVSYKLNLKGPSINVQSGCSTSLVAIDLACEALLRGDCDMAVAGGVTIRFPQARGHLYEAGMIFSPDGHTRTFDAQAAGMVTGSGAGAVLLKRLEEALADGDCVHAVIKASAINNDGAAKIGFTAPSIDGQARVIAEALDRAGVDPRSIGYVEAHGTATPVGDPIEIAALSRAWRPRTADVGFCAIGSVKTNLGHLDAAAGVTGFIKTVLALSHGRIPPNLHFTAPNPALGLETSPFFVNADACAWPATLGPRRAAVSSFGIGGTNAHIILEQAPEPAGSGLSRPHHIVAISARTPRALDAVAARLASALEVQPGIDLADVALTLLDGRARLPHRRTIVCHDAREAVGLLRGDSGWPMTAHNDRHDRPVVFLVPGYGAQYAGMARGLHDTEPVFREALDRAAAILAPHVGGNLIEVIFASDSATLRQTAWAHPALVAVAHSVAELWASWGVHPTAVLGNSLGEYAAACLAGVFRLEDMLPLVAQRARLIAAAAPGAMLAVSLGEAETARRLTGSLSLAVCVTDASSIVSGTVDDLDRFAAEVAADGIDVRRVEADCAPHSKFMDEASLELRARVAAVARRAPRVPLLSNLTGTWMTAAQAVDPDYWAAHLRSTVRLADCFDTLALTHADAAVLEIGPGRTMASPYAAQAAHRSRPAPLVVTSLRHPAERQADSEFVMGTAAQLWNAGVNLDARGMYAREHRQRVVLPSYPFERQRYSVTPGQGMATARRNVTDSIAVPVWARVPAAAPDDSSAGTGHAVVFVDAAGVALGVVDRLRAQGVDVIAVTSGDDYSANGADRVIRAGSRDDYASLMRSLPGRPDTVLHCWSLDPAGEDEATALDRGFYSLVFLAQALAEHAVESCRIVIASAGAQRVVGNEPIEPIKAMVAGPARVIPQEFDGYSVVHVDRAMDDEDDPRFVTALLAELRNRTNPSVAYRHGLRWSRRFATVDGPAATPALRDHGTYIVTGGLSGVGLELAVAIAESSETPHLVLVGRAAGQAQRQRALARLEPLGARVSFAVADVGDAAAIERVLDDAASSSGPLRGIVHAAGIPGGGSISLKTRESSQQELVAKVDGTRHLCAWARGRGLDFIVLCSSTSAFTGGFGSVAYTAANAFLDATAEASVGGETPILSINWHRWQGLGMAVETERLHHQLVGTPLLDGIRTADGRAAFVRLLGRLDLSTAAVCPVDLDLIERESRGFVARTEAMAAASSLHQRPDTGMAFAAPTTDMEKALAGIWCDVLRLDEVGIRDRFTSLGGDSLLAVRVVSRVRTTLGVVLPIRALYEQPTIAQLAGFAETLKAGNAPVIARVARQRAMPVSAAQRRFWMLHALDTGGGTYNVPKAMRLRGRLDLDALAQAWRDLIDRHETLRTSFELPDAEPVQVVHHAVDFAVPITDLWSFADDDRLAAAGVIVADEARQRFDLATAPLVRVRLVRLADDDHLLIVVLHHIVADGRSLEVLFEELALAYGARRGGDSPDWPPATVQSVDYAAFEQGWLATPATSQKLEWWNRQLAGAPPLLQLPTDYVRPPVQSFAGAVELFIIPPALTARLRALAAEHGASLFMTVVAGLSAVLARYSGQPEVCLASAVENRPFRETERLIGALLNTIILRIDCAGTPTFSDLLGRVRSTALDAYERQDVPFERVVDTVQPDRRIAASPLAQVSVSWLDGQRGFPALPGLAVEPFAFDHHSVKSDLDLEVYETPEQLHVAWFYSAALFTRESIQWMIADFISVLDAGSREPAIALATLGIRPVEARGSLMRVLPGPLPASAADEADAPLVLPRTDLERQVAAVWSELLGVDGISVHADLFSIGGHSLVAIRIAARLSEEMQVDLPAAALFNAPTIATLAERVAVLQAARLELILAEVEGLSDDEAKANL